MCAVLSQLGRHDAAMEHARRAIMIVQSTLLMHFLPNKEKKKKAGLASESLQNVQVTKEFKDRIAVLTIAYHNLGVELEYMKLYLESVESYRMAKEFAEKYLGSNDDITLNLTNIYTRAKAEINA